MQSTSIGKITEELINRSPFLRESMTENLINISALARKLQPEIENLVGKPVKEGAIVMAIKRLEPGLYYKLNLRIKNVLGEWGDFLIRSNISDYTIQNSESLSRSLADLTSKVSEDKNAFFSLCKNTAETTIVISDEYRSLMEQICKGENLIHSSTNLSSITVQLPIKNKDVYGIYYYILKQLAWEGINILEVVSTANEFTAIVHQLEVDKAFKILMQMKRGDQLI